MMKQAIVLAMLVGLWGCNAESPTMPSPTTPPASQQESTVSATATPPVEPPKVVTENCEAEKSAFTSEDNGKTVRITNGSSTCTNQYLVAMLRTNDEKTWHEFWKADGITLAPGQTGQVSISPSSGCSQPWTTRTFFGMREGEIGENGKNVLPATQIKTPAREWFGKTDSCTGPPPPTPPAPPVPPAPDPNQSCWKLGAYSVSNNGLTWTVRNNAQHPCNFVFGGFYVYDPPPKWDTQVFFDAKGVAGLPPGQTATVTLSGECGKPIQTDSYPDILISQIGQNGWNLHPANPKRYPNDNHAFGSTPVCPPNPPKATASLSAVCVPNLEWFTTTLTASLLNATLFVDGPGSDDRTFNASSAVSVTWPVGTYTWKATAINNAVFQGPSSGTVAVVDCSPPPCSVTNPPKFSATGTVVQISNKDDGVRVIVNYKFSNIQNQSVGIWWERGDDGWLKEWEPMYVKCEDGEKSATMDWTSSSQGHLLSNGARYFIIRFSGSAQNPTVISKVEIKP